MLERLKVVLARPQLLRFLEQTESNELISNLEVAAVLVEPQPIDDGTGDPEDNWVLATAVAGHVDLLVTGDRQHLLPLESIRGIPIVTPTEAIQRILSATKRDR